MKDSDIWKPAREDKKNKTIENTNKKTKDETESRTKPVVEWRRAEVSTNKELEGVEFLVQGRGDDPVNDLLHELIRQVTSETVMIHIRPDILDLLFRYEEFRRALTYQRHSRHIGITYSSKASELFSCDATFKGVPIYPSGPNDPPYRVISRRELERNQKKLNWRQEQRDRLSSTYDDRHDMDYRINPYSGSLSDEWEEYKRGIQS